MLGLAMLPLVMLQAALMAATRREPPLQSQPADEIGRRFMLRCREQKLPFAADASFKRTRPSAQRTLQTLNLVG